MVDTFHIVLHRQVSDNGALVYPKQQHLWGNYAIAIQVVRSHQVANLTMPGLIKYVVIKLISQLLVLGYLYKQISRLKNYFSSSCQCCLLNKKIWIISYSILACAKVIMTSVWSHRHTVAIHKPHRQSWHVRTTINSVLICPVAHLTISFFFKTLSKKQNHFGNNNAANHKNFLGYPMKFHIKVLMNVHPKLNYHDMFTSVSHNNGWSNDSEQLTDVNKCNCYQVIDHKFQVVHKVMPSVV
jgi:hypothetical protein